MQYKYTEYSYRIKTLATDVGLDWIFLPGGPGIGSQYLEDFCHRLNIKGNKYLIDFPKDGNNSEGELNFNKWQKGLVNLVRHFSNPVLVAHSFSGMFVLNTSGLEPYLKGLVLMNTTPVNNILLHIVQMQMKHDLPNLFNLVTECAAFPSIANYKKFWDAYKHYCFAESERKGAEDIMHAFNHNFEAYNLARDNFYPNFESKWSPRNIPTLTIAGASDCICPPNAFTSDFRYDHPNIINKIIPNAGHFSWINHFDEIDKAFGELYTRLLASKLRVASHIPVLNS